MISHRQFQQTLRVASTERIIEPPGVSLTLKCIYRINSTQSYGWGQNTKEEKRMLLKAKNIKRINGLQLKVPRSTINTFMSHSIEDNSICASGEITEFSLETF